MAHRLELEPPGRGSSVESAGKRGRSGRASARRRVDVALAERHGLERLHACVEQGEDERVVGAAAFPKVSEGACRVRRSLRDRAWDAVNAVSAARRTSRWCRADGGAPLFSTRARHERARRRQDRETGMIVSFRRRHAAATVDGEGVRALRRRATALPSWRPPCVSSFSCSPYVWVDPPALLEEIDMLARRSESKRYGLAHSLAEQGNLPMYGMPTRVRDLHVETRKARATQQTEWVTIDRDLDLAVYEFAPGSVIVKDKREHVCSGFTGALLPFIFKQPPGQHVTPMSRAFGDPFWMLECVNCNSWFRFDAQPDEGIGDCRSCSRPLEPRRSIESREPLGFRTNFHPSSDVDSEGASGRHRSIQSEAGALDLRHAQDRISESLWGRR